MLGTLGDRLRAIREDQDVMQKDLAAEFGITHSALSRYEQNKREPPVDFIVAFCHYFNVTSDFLLGMSNDYRPPVNVSIPPTLLTRDPYADLSAEHRATLDAMADVFRQQEAAQGQKEA